VIHLSCQSDWTFPQERISPRRARSQGAAKLSGELALRLFRPTPLTCSPLKIAGASRHWSRTHHGRQTGLSGNIETLPGAIRCACGPSNDRGASSNGYANAAGSPRPHLRSPQRPLLDDRQSRLRGWLRLPRCVPANFARARPPKELSSTAPGKTTTLESDASGTPQNVRFLTAARQIPHRTREDLTKYVAVALHFLRSGRQSCSSDY
jgi:hypothetical protein